MKKIKNFFKKNIKLLIGLIMGIVIPGTCVYAATILYAANEVNFDNTNVNLKIVGTNNDVTNVQEALDTLNQKAEDAKVDPMDYLCPGCLYTKTVSGYTTWNTRSQTAATVTSSTSGITTDYTTLGNSFLGLVTNSSNQVVSAFACGLYNNDSSKPFCIQGSTGSTFSANLKLLQSSNYWNNSCDDDGSIVDCDGSVYAGARSGGIVNVLGSSYCTVSDYGFFRCL